MFQNAWLNASYEFLLGTGPRKVITALVLTRLFIFAVGIRSMQLLPKFPGMPSFGHPFIIDMWIRGDAGWYLTIANEGYQYIPGQMASAGYFPLFPLLMRAFGALADNALVGIIISNIALILAVILLYRLLKLDVDANTSARTILYLLIFPASFFLSGIHSEALFLLTTVASFYAARKGNWAFAGLFGAFAALTRSTGIVMLPVLLIEYAYQNNIRRLQDLSKIKKEIAWLLLIPLALLGFGAYLYLQFGTPFAYIDTQSTINASFNFPFSKVLDLFIDPTASALLGAPFVLLGILLIAATWNTARPSYTVYSLLIILASLSLVGTYAAYRYMCVLFPLFLILAKTTQNRPALHNTLMYTSLFILALFMSLFVRGWAVV